MVQTQSLRYGEGDRPDSLPSFYAPLITPPYVIEEETASNYVAALRAGDDVFDMALRAAPYVHYFHIEIEYDSARTNLRGARILFAMLEDALRGDDVVVLMHTQKCHGHRGQIILRVLIKRSRLLKHFFCLAHLLRIQDYRTRLVKGTHEVLEKCVRIIHEEPPPHLKSRMRELFLRTLLRGSGKRRYKLTKRGSLKHTRDQRAWNLFELIWEAMPGYVSEDGTIWLYTRRSRGAQIVLAKQASWQRFIQSSDCVTSCCKL